jgi:hypothetical protein
MSFKEFSQAEDISTQISVINEVIPLTGSILSGTEFYTKTYLNITSGSAISGGFFQTVYDGAPTSVSSSALFDMTFGISTSSLLYGFTETFLKNEKNRIYKEMATLLLGDKNNFFTFGSTAYNEVVFLLPRRRIFKDEIKKGNTSVVIQMTGTGDSNALTLTDAGASTAFVVGPAGDEATLYSGSTAIGKVYYDAGIIAFATGALVPVGVTNFPHWSGSVVLNKNAISGNFDNFNTGLRNHLNLVQFNNQTNLHSTIYFCRALNADFNYSTNPTFIDSDGRIVVTSGTSNQTRTYVTTIGLYDINDNLLAVAKASEPVKKSPDSELVFRVRLSY